MARTYRYTEEVSKFEGPRERSRFSRTDYSSQTSVSCPYVKLRRAVSRHDSVRIRRILTGVFEELDEDVRTEVDQFMKPAVSTLDASTASRIVGAHYPSIGSTKEVENFNEKVFRHRSEINAKNPYLFVKLGTIATFGGDRFVGAYLEGEDSETLGEEHSGLLRRLIPNPDDPVRTKSERRNAPHLSLVTTKSPEAARALEQILTDNEEFQNMWLQLDSATTRSCGD